MNYSLLHRLELIGLCSSDGIMRDWGTLLEDYCNVEMQLSLELF